MNKLNTSVFLYLLARLWSVDLQDQNPLLIMKKVQKCVLFGVIWVVYSFHNPVFTYGQTTIWLPKVDRTESELTYTYSVQAPDYLADWILNTPAAGSGELIQKTVDGKNYTVIKRIATWDLGGSHPEKTGQIRFDTKLGDMDGTWKFEPKLKDESQVIQALNSAVPPTDGPWKSAIILALKWEGTTLPTLKFTEKISQLDQAKARMVNIAKNTKAGKFYPEVKVPVDVAGYRAAMLEIVNLARKDPDYRSKNKFASNLRDDIAQTTSSQRQKIYHNSPTSSLFDDLQLDDKLNDLAQIQAEWAAKNNYMGHNGPPNYNGVTMVDFGQRTQYFTPGYISAGEAGGWATSPEDWMQGETHFRPWFSIGHDVDFIGFGVAIGGDG
uniref:CAP domain-containing protein n=1 Tax=Persicitalea sp. TaxID=3100273 RepID=UPI00359407AE